MRSNAGSSAQSAGGEGRGFVPSTRSSSGAPWHDSARVKKICTAFLLTSVTHSFDGLAIVVYQFHPDLSYVNIHSAVAHVNIITPCLVHEGLAVPRLPFFTGQVMQELNLRFG